MGTSILFVLALTAIVAGLGLAFVWRRRRFEALARVADEQGLVFRAGDLLGALGLPFTLLRRGDRRRVTASMSGTLAGRDAHLFELEFVRVHQSGAQRRESRTYATCAHVRLGGLHLPGVRISPENLVTRLGDRLGFRDQQFESEEFNRRYQVQGTDPRATSAVVDARMMALLLELTDTKVAVELRGDHLVVWTDARIRPEAWPGLHHVAASVADRVPRVARELYPSSGDDDLWLPGWVPPQRARPGWFRVTGG